eukprot:superscaffoldBa00002586_g14733
MFRKNKVRDDAPDSDSDCDSDEVELDLLLRERLATALLCFISSQLQPAVLRVCLQTLRILSRDRRALGPMVTDSALLTLAHLGGISLLQACPQQEERAEDQSHSQIHRAASGHEEAADADATLLAVSSVVSPSCPVVACAAKNNDLVHQWCKWTDDGHVMPAHGKKDIQEENIHEEEIEEDGDVCRNEAIKVLCNVIYNSPRAQETASTLRLLQGLWESLKQGIRSGELSSGQFYKLRLLFLLTALRPELRLQLQQERGVAVLTKALEQCLAVRWGEGYEVLNDSTAPPISKKMYQEVIEILKTLFNITHRLHRQEPDEPVTSRKDWMTSMNRMVMAGETADSTERRQTGQQGLAPQTAAPVMEHPSKLRRTLLKHTPRDARGGEDEHPNQTDLLAMTQANGQLTVCICGKVCKNLRGLKIHQTKMACLRGEQVKQCAGAVANTTDSVVLATEPGQTEEEPDLESPHSALTKQEEDAALYRHLAAVLRHCLLLSCDGEGALEELQGHTVNILSALPLTCLDVLLSVCVNKASQKWEGVNMDCVHTLLLFMDRRLNRASILPPLRDVAIRPEQDTTLRGQLVRLMTHVDTDVKHCAAELLFVLCKENVSRFVKYTGYGNAAGLLAARGLLNGRRKPDNSQYACQYSSDSDSDTEEYREAKARINLVTGRVEAEQPDPMEGMTEEEKEVEAFRLISMINRLSQ